MNIKSLMKTAAIVVGTMYVVHHVEPIKDAVTGGDSWF